MYTKGDFHIHTTASDGRLTPTEVVKLAKRNKVDIIAITDHNTTKGIPEAIEAGKKYGVKVIPGIELSVRYNYNKIHILGYFKNDSYRYDGFQETLNYIRKCGRVRDKYRNNKKNRIQINTGIEFLRMYGAAVVLAHPIRIKKCIRNEILEKNFDGIEARYYKNTEEETRYFIEVVKSKGLFYTAGSDFHEEVLSNKHGSIGDVYLNSEEIEEFIMAARLYNI